MKFSARERCRWRTLYATAWFFVFIAA